MPSSGPTGVSGSTTPITASPAAAARSGPPGRRSAAPRPVRSSTMTSAWVSRFSVNQPAWNAASPLSPDALCRARASTPKVARSAAALSRPNPVMKRRKSRGRSSVGRRRADAAGRSNANASCAASKHRFCTSTCAGSMGRKGSINPAVSMAMTLPRLEESVIRR